MGFADGFARLKKLFPSLVKFMCLIGQLVAVIVTALGLPRGTKLRAAVDLSCLYVLASVCLPPAGHQPARVLCLSRVHMALSKLDLKQLQACAAHPGQIFERIGGVSVQESE